MFDYTITLSDGTEVKANLNMNTWESETEPDSAVFEGNTDEVSYTTPTGEIVELGECKFVKGSILNGKYTFFLNPLTEAEKVAREIESQRADIDYIMIMEDL
jgi:hypothetical protein